MRITQRETRSGELGLRVENIDDLWHLYNLIRTGDRVFSLTQRREEKATDKLREKRGEKRTLYLGLTVEKVEFHDFSDRLRVHGIILQDQTDAGSYHTLNLEVGSQLKIVKDRWEAFDRRRIKQAVEEAKRPSIVVVSLDEDEALVAVLRQYGVQEIARIRSGRAGKQFAGKYRKEDYFAEVLDVVKLQGKDIPLLVCGPGFTKEDILKFGRGRDPELFRGAMSASTGSDGMTGVNEILKSGAISKLTQGIRIEFETSLMEEVLKELSTSGKVAYGYQQVVDAVRKGAVETVIITDRVLREEREKAKVLLNSAERVGAGITVISEAHDSGKQLESLSGYAALLRFVSDR